MASSSTLEPSERTLASLLESLGDIPPRRILVRPYPATEADLIRLNDAGNSLYELVDGTLVEKAMGMRESIVAAVLIRLLSNWIVNHDLGILSGSDGPVRLFPDLVRIPDLAFVSWDRLPNGQVPEEPIPDLVPNLVVEVLSASNTAGEMQRKREEYFRAGVVEMWEIDLVESSVRVYSAEDISILYQSGQKVTCETVLPGFWFHVDDLFAPLQRT